MNHLLELVFEVLGSEVGPRSESRVIRLFVMLSMGVAGICFLVFAGIGFARMDVTGFLVGLFLVALALLCFWLVRRGTRPPKSE